MYVVSSGDFGKELPKYAARSMDDAERWLRERGFVDCYACGIVFYKKPESFETATIWMVEAK